jgi:long-chain acyl-CoA synthetase
MNVAEVLRVGAGSHPDLPALIFHGRSLSYGELDDLADRVAGALAGVGVTKGDRVALLAGNVPEFVATLYGALRLGAVVCPLNTMLTAEELRAILHDADAAAIVSDQASMAEVVRLRGQLPGVRTVVVIGGPPAPPGTVSLEEILGGGSEAPAVAAEDSDLAVIAYTAGTTAAPKGAMLTHGNLTANLRQMGSLPILSEAGHDVVLVALPLFHIYALNAVLGLTLHVGGTAVLAERFDPVEALRLVERHRVTVLFGAPPMFAAWLGVDRSDVPEDLSSLRVAASGASALPGEVMTAFAEKFGVTIWEGYGLTETAPAVTTNAAGDVAKPGSIGLPLQDVEVRLVDDDGEDAEEGDPGEIWVRGPNVFAGYWNRPEETARVLRDGWFRTGDVAYRDEDGYLFIVDRKKDLVIVSGFNVYPREVEEAIERHPLVAEAAVVGIADERTGEAVQAWVVPVQDARLEPADVVEFLQGSLARFKQPKDVRVVASLPHHVTGKVLRRALRGEP